MGGFETWKNLGKNLGKLWKHLGKTWENFGKFGKHLGKLGTTWRKSGEFDVISLGTNGGFLELAKSGDLTRF